MELMTSIRNRSWARWIHGSCAACALLFAVGLTGRATGQEAGKDITLVKRDGTQLRVPSTGPLASPAAQDVAREIAAYDKGPKSPSARGADPAVVEAIRRLAQETRNDAVDQLDTTLRVAQSTSGALDARLLRAARQSADMLKQIIGSPPPPSLLVRTEIGSSIPNAVLHYCLRADYRKKACSWQSYNFGAVLSIGLYMFRVQSDAGVAQERDEQVLVLNEPTKVTILPMR